MGKVFKPRFKTANKGHKTLNLERDKRQALYNNNNTWKKFSREFLRVNKECYMCGEPSEVTDHLEPHLGRVEVFEKDGNFLALCSICHNTITSKFDRVYRAGDSIEPKVKFMNDTRAMNEVKKGRSFIRPKFMSYPK